MMTSIFFAGGGENDRKLGLSSEGAAAPPPPAGPATATAAAEYAPLFLKELELRSFEHREVREVVNNLL